MEHTGRIMLKPYLSVFFLGLIVVISIGLMNLVTAAVLEYGSRTNAHYDHRTSTDRCVWPYRCMTVARNAMQAAVQDAEAEKSAMLNTVKDCFGVTVRACLLMLELVWCQFLDVPMFRMQTA